jgi:outer membrane lipoprotein SlyB
MVRTVQLTSDQRLNAGSAIGAAVGYGAANQVKNREYRNAARVTGGVIGAAAGTAVQKGLSGRRAVEIYVRDLSDRRQRVLAVVKTPMWMCAKVIGSSWWGRVRRPGWCR